MPTLRKDLRGPLTRRFQQALVTVTNNSVRPIQKMWAGLDNHDESSIPALTQRSAKLLAASKTTAVRQAAGYYSTLSGHRAIALDPDEIDAVAELRAPFISYWGGLKQGLGVDVALALGASRVIDMVSNLVVTSARQAGGAYIAKAELHVHGWERIPDAGACQWCEEVAESIYHDAGSADFGHDRCGCTAAPLF